ncbi:MAG: DUF3783 domain-containing protein [Clostridia bacterium]|nr:DUF3783 domain-containing protein [Clostridia bacterium]
MAQPMLLSFNMQGDRKVKLTMTCMKNKIRLVTVNEDDQAQTLGALCSFMPREDKAAPEQPFTDEMVVFANFTNQTLNGFLQTWKQLGQKPIALKAVVTPTNVSWTAVQLHAEITEEHNAMHSGANPAHGE